MAKWKFSTMSSANRAASCGRYPTTSASPVDSSPSSTSRANSGTPGIATRSMYHLLIVGAGPHHARS